MGKFKPLLEFPLMGGRALVISETYDGKISMVQQVTIEEADGKKTKLFLKNSFLFEKEMFVDYIKAVNALNFNKKDE